jgi:hypothetical protein
MLESRPHVFLRYNDILRSVYCVGCFQVWVRVRPNIIFLYYFLVFGNDRLSAVGGRGRGRCSVILPVVFSLSLKETEEREQERGGERARKGGESEREGRLALSERRTCCSITEHARWFSWI